MTGDFRCQDNISISLKSTFTVRHIYSYMPRLSVKMSIFDGSSYLNLIYRRRKRLGGYIKIEGFKIHDFRHTCASRLIQNGMSLYEVANILGHTDVQTTQRYAHLECKKVGQRARDIMEGVTMIQ